MKVVLAVAIAAAVACTGLSLYWHYLFVFYPEHAVTSFTGSTDHRTVEKRHSDYDWYIEVVLPPDQGEALLRHHRFRPGYDPRITLPKISSPDIKACSECLSYFEGSGHGVYGYFLGVLSPDKTTLQLYEFFGD
jgi:hypothetical protein